MKKGATQIGGGLILLLLLFLVLYWYQTSDVTLRIQLQNVTIPQGESVVINYKVTNSFKEPISDAKIDYWLNGVTVAQTEIIGAIPKSEERESKLRIGTPFGLRGSYVVTTNLTYSQNNITKNIFLTLNVNIV